MIVGFPPWGSRTRPGRVCDAALACIQLKLVVTPVDNGHKHTNYPLVGKASRAANSLIRSTAWATATWSPPARIDGRRARPGLGHRSRSLAKPIGKAIGFQFGRYPTDKRLRAGPEVNVTSAWQPRIADGHQPPAPAGR